LKRSDRVGALYQAAWDAAHHVAFREELRRFGFIDGQNLSIDKLRRDPMLSFVKFFGPSELQFEQRCIGRRRPRRNRAD
jgi:hypothetical protein